jgi:hypothetical protein
MVQGGCLICGGLVYSLDGVRGQCSGSCGNLYNVRTKLLRRSGGAFPAVPVEVPDFQPATGTALLGATVAGVRSWLVALVQPLFGHGV